MNHTDIELLEVDHLGILLAQIAELTKKADMIKDAIKDEAIKNGGVMQVVGNLYEAKVIEANRSVVDYKKLCADMGITAEQLAVYTKVTAVFSVKTTERK